MRNLAILEEELQPVTDVLECARCGCVRDVENGLCLYCRPKPASAAEVANAERPFGYIEFGRRPASWERCGGGWRRRPKPRMN